MILSLILPSILALLLAINCCAASYGKPDSGADLSVQDRLLILKEPVETESDMDRERDEMRAFVEASLRAKNFGALEGKASELRASRAQLPDGRWKLDLFYWSFYSADKKRDLSDSQFHLLIKQTHDWLNANPDSFTARIFMANLYQQYAWQARGTAFSREVSKESWRLMFEREKQASEILKGLKTSFQKCPRAYYVAMEIAKDQSQRKEFERLFNQCLLKFPTYKNVYFSKVRLLQPRWDGAPGEWERFAASTANKVKGNEGDIFYAQLLWAVDTTGWYSQDSLFKKFQLDYPRLKRGFQALMQRYPKSLAVMSIFCHLAGDGGDRQTAIALYKKLAGKVDKAAWLSKDRFTRLRNDILH